MSFAAIKLIHVSCVVISYLMFVVRGIWSLTGSTKLQWRPLKVVPHLVDSILLASAIALAAMLRISPLESAWLQTKITALLLYIVLGSIAIKSGKTRRKRLTAWIMAQLTFFFIIVTAVTRSSQL